MSVFSKYHPTANNDNVDICYLIIKPLYEQYSGIDIAEAHYRIRKELNLIKEVEEKKQRIQKLKQELDLD